jgi:hypothetical protein
MQADNTNLIDRIGIATDVTTEDHEPQASTSALTFEDGDQPTPDESISNSIQAPTRPWGLAEYGIPPPPSDLQPDPAVEVCSITQNRIAKSMYTAK